MNDKEIKELLKHEYPEFDNKGNEIYELVSNKRKRPFFRRKIVLIPVASVVIALLVVLVIALSGNESVSTRPFSVGFENGEAQPNDWIGISSNQSSVKVGDSLTVKVYYGTLCSYPDDYLKMFKYNGSSPNDVLVELEISYGLCTKELLDKGYYTYIEPEYIINYTTISRDVFKVIERFGADEYPRLGANSKCDDIIIPSSYFNDNMGFISFSICEYGIYDGFVDQDNSNGTSISIYYIIDGDNITLYSNYYDFYNNAIK